MEHDLFINRSPFFGRQAQNQNGRIEFVHWKIPFDSRAPNENTRGTEIAPSVHPLTVALREGRFAR